MQAMSRPYGTDIVGGEPFILFHILHHKQGTAKGPAGFFLVRHLVTDLPQRLLHGAYRLHHTSKFVGLLRECTIWPCNSAGKGKMFFYQAGSQCHCSHRYDMAHGMIGQSGRHAKCLCQVRNSP